MLKTKPQSPFPSLPAFLGSLPTVQDPCLSQGGQSRANRAVFSNIRSFLAVRGPGCASVRGAGGSQGMGLLPSPPPTAARAGPRSSCRQRKSHRTWRRWGSRVHPCPPMEYGNGGKNSKKLCPAFNSTAESWVSLQSHWEAFLSGIALGRTCPRSFFLKAVAYHFS